MDNTTTSKKQLTNLDAVVALIDFAKSNGFADTAVLGKAGTLRATLARQLERSHEPSKKQMLNANLARDLGAWAVDLGHTFTVREVAKWLEGRADSESCSVQKATAICTAAVKAGYLTRYVDGRNVAFGAAVAEN